MIWSILIPTIEGSEEFFLELYTALYKQIANNNLIGQVEIVSIKDNCEVSIGVKRHQMLEKAQGEYVSHIDDDDIIKDNYVITIFEHLKSNPDCIGFNVCCDFPSGYYKAVVSNRYKEWENNKDGYDYVRSPNHLSVIKREYALKIGFSDMKFGEDYDFSKRMVESGLLKNEIFINQELYTYRFNPNK